jgi:hypothetical protein
MRKLILLILSSILLLSFESCSQSYNSLTNFYFRIDLYSGGGFTGVENGITISSEGWAKYWKRSLNSLRQMTDSIAIPRSNMEEIIRLIKKPEIFSYQNKFTGNYTTYLVLLNDIQFNQISFNSSDLPSNMPIAIKDLIAKINSIKK